MAKIIPLADRGTAAGHVRFDAHHVDLRFISGMLRCAVEKHSKETSIRWFSRMPPELEEDISAVLTCHVEGFEFANTKSAGRDGWEVTFTCRGERAEEYRYTVLVRRDWAKS